MSLLFAGCEHDEGVQTHIFVPKVTQEESGNCYKIGGLKMIRWANLIQSHREQKPVIEQFHMNTAQKNERIYANIPKGFLEDKDPIWEVFGGIQNIFSIPISAMIAATTELSLEHERAKCLKKEQEANVETPSEEVIEALKAQSALE
ncbi:hypothetical protein FAI40_04770 [Acetobacteraceae bacterium]|nr:hypothetical protein FAI40_04770 [Acetobacteraceae bacterium]